MRRSVASLAFLVLSWSQLVALQCDMDATAPGHHDEGMPLAASTVAQHHMPADEGPPAPHRQGHGGSAGCLMILACSTASVRPARAVSMIRFPAVFVQARFAGDLVPVAADLAVEPPPPRQAI